MSSELVIAAHGAADRTVRPAHRYVACRIKSMLRVNKGMFSGGF